MNTSTSQLGPVVAPPPYSTRNTRHHINLFCHAPGATRVSLIGDFNRWRSNANPMGKMLDGSRMASLGLPHGHHQYLFLVDDNPALDPNASGKSRNERNETVSLIAVS
jgi:1,4-alpha-glucan branching enzyme